MPRPLREDPIPRKSHVSLTSAFKLQLERFGRNRLKIVAEGDSWFGYPPPWLIAGPPSNILEHISRSRDFDSIMLRLARNGDEAVEMLSGGSKHRLFETFSELARDIDVFLFSGGGNDLVGAWDMPFLLHPYSDQTTGEHCVRQDRFLRKLASIENAYRDLVSIRDDAGCRCPIITHTYAIPEPTGRGALFAGGLIRVESWVKPYADLKHIPPPLQGQIVRYLLQEFARMLQRIAADANVADFHVVDTQPLLDPWRPEDWRDEIHPSSAGFGKVATAVVDEIQRRVGRGDAHR